MSEARKVVRLEPVYERHVEDWYVEPAWAVERLIGAERFTGLIWDPCCGAGNIPRAFEAAGFQAIGTDLVDRGYGSVRDFLDLPQNFRPVPNIVFNPPYAGAQEFVERALERTLNKVAALLPLTFLEGQKRSAWLYASPLARVHVFAARVSMPPGNSGSKPEGGKKAFAWFVWSHDHRGFPTLHTI